MRSRNESTVAQVLAADQKTRSGEPDSANGRNEARLAPRDVSQAAQPRGITATMDRDARDREPRPPRGSFHTSCQARN